MYEIFWLVLVLSNGIYIEMDIPVSNFTGYKGKYLESELILCSRLTKTVVFINCQVVHNMVVRHNESIDCHKPYLKVHVNLYVSRNSKMATNSIDEARNEDTHEPADAEGYIPEFKPELDATNNILLHPDQTPKDTSCSQIRKFV